MQPNQVPSSPPHKAKHLASYGTSSDKRIRVRLGSITLSEVTRLNAKEQNALASRMKLADFREAWIQRFREAGAELIGLLDGVQSVTPTQKTSELAAKIRLMMNRKDKRYPRLIQILEAIGQPGQTNPSVHAEHLGDCIQSILKDEWEVLKNDLKYAPPAVKLSA